MNLKRNEIVGFEFDQDEAEIAPCPFCVDGGEPSIVNSKSPAYYTVMCNDCSAEGPKVDQDFYVNHLHDNIGDENMDTEVISFVCKTAALELWNGRYNLH